MAEPVPISERVAQLGETLRASRGFVVEGDTPDDPWGGTSLTDSRTLRWSSKCPDRFTTATVDTLDDILAADIRDWCTDPAGRNLLLIGAVGVGKTHAALAAARHRWIECGDDVTFWPIVEMLDALRPLADATDVTFRSMLDVDMLVLDDLGSEKATDWTAERLFAVVNRRWMERRPIIATSNHDPTGLREAVGSRTYSRLIGDGAVVLGVGGEDRRRT